MRASASSSRIPIAIAAGLSLLALMGWQAISTVSRAFPTDSQEYLLNAGYLDAHAALPPKYVSYEYSAPPLFEALAVAAEHIVAAAPNRPLELPWNAATRLLWFVLIVGSVGALTSRRRRLRLAGAGGLTVGLLWGLDEAIALGKTEQWSAGQLLALASALGLVTVSGLIAREIWPGHAGRALATAAFVAAYPILLQYGSLFHPETTMAFLSALVFLVFLRAERRGWPAWSGVSVGLLCGLDLLTRQSAAVVVVCALLTAIVVGGKRARRFMLSALGGILLTAGPWLGYAAYAWGNPLQGNLERAGDMIPGGEPRSFYISFPLRSLLLHPYREHFADQLLPQLHAGLWSDWIGVFHAGAWADPSGADRIAASTQSVLGLAGDALALGGLAAIGVPALLRLRGSRRRRESDVAFGFLALVAITGFVAFTAQIVRFPQDEGVEIKASYLLFAAPCFAVFSVAAWLAIARWKRSAGIALVVVAALYSISYGTSLAATFSHRYPQVLQVPLSYGYIDLGVSLSGPTGTSPLGSEPDVDLSVTNRGTGNAGDVTLLVHLARGMRLLGPPYYERGFGCTGRHTLNCDLDFLDAGMSTPIRFAVQLTTPGKKTISAVVSSYGLDANPADNRASVTTYVPPR